MAWTCPACGCEIEEEGFDTCWQCGRVNSAIKNPMPPIVTTKPQSAATPASAATDPASTNVAIPGIQGLSVADIQREINRGGRFVAYHQVTSVILVSWRQEVSLCFLQKGQSHPANRLGAILHSLFFGWWGFPWGALWTITAILTNLMGGEDVTERTIADLNRRLGWNLTGRHHDRAAAWSAFVPYLVAMIICCALAWLAIVIFVFPHMSDTNGMAVGYLMTAVCVIMLYFVSPLNKR